MKEEDQKNKTNHITEKSLEKLEQVFDKIKNTTSTTLEKSKEATNISIKYSKKLIRKKAIENIREKLEFAQKKESDFTKEEMRKMISKEEKKIIKSLGLRGGLTTILAMFGIANF
jgi:regulator of sigma D|tara:strand:- start:102 stop:446 length:345 start_codon:yes stop_codon:yes gene_type:complete